MITKSVRAGEYTAPPGAGAHDHGDLGNDAGSQDIAHEDLAVGSKAAHALLDAGAAGVVEADERDAALQGQVLDPADLVGLHHAEGAAEHREVLGEDGDAAAIDATEAGDDAVARILLVVQTEVRHVVGGQGAQFLEGPLVQQQGQTLPRGQLPFGVLLFDALGAAPQQCLFAHLAQFHQVIVHAGLHMDKMFHP